MVNGLMRVGVARRADAQRDRAAATPTQPARRARADGPPIARSSDGHATASHGRRQSCTFSRRSSAVLPSFASSFPSSQHRQVQTGPSSPPGEQRLPVRPVPCRSPSHGSSFVPGMPEIEREVAAGDVQSQAVPGQQPIAGVAHVDCAQARRSSARPTGPDRAATSRAAPSGVDVEQLDVACMEAHDDSSASVAVTGPARSSGASRSLAR